MDTSFPTTVFSRFLGTLRALTLALLVAATASCGGSGGQGPGGDGQGLVLLSFLQASTDNVSLNTLLKWRFSETVNAATITPASIQIREGGAFGLAVQGTYSVDGNVVTFEPRLPSLCDLSDAALKPGTTYRVQVIGWPEEFAITNTTGQKLNQTTTREFSTRGETDPDKFTDQVPAATPFVLSMTPSNGSVAAESGSAANRQRIVITLNENVDPCSVSGGTVFVDLPEVGGSQGASVAAPSGRFSGFVTGGSDLSDQATADHGTWGSDTGTSWPGGAQTLPVSVHLLQTFTATQIIISPIHGQDPNQPELGGILPENTMIRVRLTAGIKDFGGQLMTPFLGSFTVENLNSPAGTITIDNEGETPYDSNLTTADVNTGRASGIVQAYLLFAGDGDNGSNIDSPSLPNSPSSGCTFPFQANDLVRDAFDPTTDIRLDTGPVNTCINVTDSSTAVIWEFATLRIRSGVTVRLDGSNPAIFLVSGDALIESGGVLRARGDNSGGVPNGRGGNGTSTATATNPGGVGVAGGGDGGACLGGNGSGTTRYSGGGLQGYFFTGGGVNASVGTDTGPGSGHGNTSVQWTAQTSPNNRNSGGGGGAGHSTDGTSGANLGSGSAPTKLDLAVDGVAGSTYGGSANSTLQTPQAGTGGGAGGEVRPFSGNSGRGTGGGGGAGGGFIDITAGGDIAVLGQIDVAGSPGGGGATQPFNPNFTFQPGTGGGGGGSGGGIRLLTPGDITFGATTIVTAAGGAGGAGGQSQSNQPPVNPGGNGGLGRIVLEDSDSVIGGFASAVLIPTEGDAGFHRGVFDATRFSGGGLMPSATTEPFPVGPFSPAFVEPVGADFVAGAPAVTTPGVGQLVILIEAQSYDMMLNGTQEATGNGWRTIGHFIDSGVETAPTYVPGHPGAFARPLDNVGNGGIDNMASLNGDEFVQFRFTLFLDPAGVGALDPGAFMDSWIIRYTSDN